jgi:hypothetical protein
MLKGHFALSTLTLVILYSCGYQATQLYVAHQTVIGIDAAVNNEQKAGHLLIGYDRRFLTISPKSVPMSNTERMTENPQETMAPQPTGSKPVNTSVQVQAEKNTKQPRDVMSVLSCSHMEIDGLFLTKFVERLATGQAAKRLAGKVDVFDCSEVKK